MDWSKQPYLDFAWNNLSNPQRAGRFFEFADQLLYDMEPLRKMSITSYHELCVLFQIEEGNEQLYEAHASAVLRAMLEYLSTPGAIASKVRLNELFLAHFDREFDKVKQGELPEADIVECMKDYYTIDGRNHGRKIVEYLIRVLNNAYSHKNKSLVPAVYGMIESSAALSRTFFATVLSSPGLPAMLFDPYFELQLKKAAKARDVIDIVSVWARNHPIVLESDLFSKLAESQMVEKLRKESDPVRSVNVILDQLDHIEQNPQSGISSTPGGTKLMDRLIYAANLFLLMEINLDRLTKEQLLQIDFLRVPKEFMSWVTRFDKRIQSKAAVMLAAYQWMNSDTDGKIFNGLDSAEREQVQQLGRRWLQNEVEPSRFGAITLAFCADIDTGAVDYTGLLEFLHHYGPKPDMVYKYIQWSVKEPLFVRPRGLVPAYANAIVNYMKRHDSTAFKNKEYVKAYFDRAPAVLKPVYAKAKTELASPMVKLFRRNRKPIMLSSIVLLIILVAGSTYLILQANGVFEDRKTASDEITPPPVITPITPKPDVAEVPLITAAQEKVGTNKSKTTQLSFHFRESETCSSYKIKQVKLLAADGTALVEVLYPKLDHKCAISADLGTEPGSGTEADMDGTTNGDGTGSENPDTETAGQTGQASQAVTNGTEIGVGSSTTDDEKDKAEAGTTKDLNAVDPAKKDEVGNDVKPPTETNDPTNDSIAPSQQPYSSLVKIDLGKRIDMTKISKVVVDNKEFPLTTDQKTLDMLKKNDTSAK
ncbi:hypothetical protein [Paenibacillus pini]|uniref:Uncharacterized protein n=1 Tax=Paenibacillus pini JCM 16418 TaxID=1236976 RepID=W7YFV6_9BACL|nr:hypothetical protein [Paenibacillus pini]GAF09810.1 hypothetical protein JCM16418_3966 [Paenibacillus pini JCM 16418]